jgi:hypothetical protein
MTGSFSKLSSKVDGFTVHHADWDVVNCSAQPLASSPKHAMGVSFNIRWVLALGAQL